MSNPPEILTADGRPLKAGLSRALRAHKIRALLLILPLLLFILVSFVAPIGDMLFRSVENQIVEQTLPRTVAAIEQDWHDHSSVPPESVYAALAYDLRQASERRLHTRIGSRLNYETTGIASLFRKSGRRIDRIGSDYADRFVQHDAIWGDPVAWMSLMAGPHKESPIEQLSDFHIDPEIAAILPETTSVYGGFVQTLADMDGVSPAEEVPWNSVYLALYRDLTAGPIRIQTYEGEYRTQLIAAAKTAESFDQILVSDIFADIDDDWMRIDIWETIEVFSPHYTSGYYLTAVDLKLTHDGIESQAEDKRIYLLLFQRTAFMSLAITVTCILLGYPIAYLLAHVPIRTSNLLLILVLLPFWTSLLVRTSAWKVLLQQEGVINDILVWLGIVADESRLAMINNQFGTIVAMTHILLPFMILPLYSVMKTIQPSYVRAAKSLGANDWTAFWRVYFPQSVPGIGAGCILVFILSIGYYITPEIVGGRTGTFISNRIAFHISQSLNWGLAAALGALLLITVLVLYWLYDRIVGIDNVKLG